MLSSDEDGDSESKSTPRTKARRKIQTDNHGQMGPLLLRVLDMTRIDPNKYIKLCKSIPEGIMFNLKRGGLRITRIDGEKCTIHPEEYEEATKILKKLLTKERLKLSKELEPQYEELEAKDAARRRKGKRKTAGSRVNKKCAMRMTFDVMLLLSEKDAKSGLISKAYDVLEVIPKGYFLELCGEEVKVIRVDNGESVDVNIEEKILGTFHKWVPKEDVHEGRPTITEENISLYRKGTLQYIQALEIEESEEVLESLHKSHISRELSNAKEFIDHLDSLDKSMSEKKQRAKDCGNEDDGVIELESSSDEEGSKKQKATKETSPVTLKQTDPIQYMDSEMFGSDDNSYDLGLQLDDNGSHFSREGGDENAKETALTASKQSSKVGGKKVAEGVEDGEEKGATDKGGDGDETDVSNEDEKDKEKQDEGKQDEKEGEEQKQGKEDEEGEEKPDQGKDDEGKEEEGKDADEREQDDDEGIGGPPSDPPDENQDIIEGERKKEGEEFLDNEYFEPEAQSALEAHLKLQQKFVDDIVGIPITQIQSELLDKYMMNRSDEVNETTNSRTYNNFCSLKDYRTSQLAALIDLGSNARVSYTLQFQAIYMEFKQHFEDENFLTKSRFPTYTEYSQVIGNFIISIVKNIDAGDYPFTDNTIDPFLEGVENFDHPEGPSSNEARETFYLSTKDNNVGRVLDGGGSRIDDLNASKVESLLKMENLPMTPFLAILFAHMCPSYVNKAYDFDHFDDMDDRSDVSQDLEKRVLPVVHSIYESGQDSDSDSSSSSSSSSDDDTSTKKKKKAKKSAKKASKPEEAGGRDGHRNSTQGEEEEQPQSQSNVGEGDVGSDNEKAGEEEEEEEEEEGGKEIRGRIPRKTDASNETKEDDKQESDEEEEEPVAESGHELGQQKVSSRLLRKYSIKSEGEKLAWKFIPEYFTTAPVNVRKIHPDDVCIKKDAQKMALAETFLSEDYPTDMLNQVPWIAPYLVESVNEELDNYDESKDVTDPLESLDSSLQNVAGEITIREVLCLYFNVMVSLYGFVYVI